MIIGIDASRANVREKTGTEWYSWYIIRHLAPLLADHQVRLYTREPLEPGLQGLGGQVGERVLRWPPGVLWSHIRLAWELWRHPPDVLLVTADTVPIIHPRNTVTVIHDVAFEKFPELYRGRSVQRRLGWLRPLVHLAVRLATLGRYSASERDYHRWSARHALRASRTVLTVSEFSKREIVETLAGDPRMIAVVYQGVKQPEDFASIDETAARDALGRLQITRPYILFVGRLEKKKNIGMMLTGYARYRRRAEHPLDLVLAGSPGYGWGEAWDTVPDDVRPFIHVLSWQGNDTIRILESSARLMMYISRHEGFGVPPLESMSAGVPVMASRFASIPEALGDAAYYIDGDDPESVAHGILRLQNDEPLRRSLIERGQAQVRKYTWEKSARQIAPFLTSQPLDSPT